MQVSCSVIESLIDLGEGNPSFWTHGCPQPLCHDYFLIEHISRNWNTREGLMDIYWVYLHCHLIIEAFLCSGWYLAVSHIDQKYLYMCLSQGATQIPSPQISLLPIFQWCSSPWPFSQTITHCLGNSKTIFSSYLWIKRRDKRIYCSYSLQQMFPFDFCLRKTLDWWNYAEESMSSCFCFQYIVLIHQAQVFMLS